MSSFVTSGSTVYGPCGAAVAAMYLATLANAGAGPLSKRQGGATCVGLGSELHLLTSQRRPAATRSVQGGGRGSCSGGAGASGSRVEKVSFPFAVFFIG
jgi:hypothetical protein